MKTKILLLLSAVLFCFILTGCGEDPAVNKFQQDINAFCSQIAEIDTGINSIDAQSETARYELLAYLDQLDQAFKALAEISIPEKYAYMEQLTSEASSYMTTAVEAYHEAFEGDSYNEYTAEYARENYERAYKRVTVLLQLLRGEEITGADVTIEPVSQ
ncbi:MAG: hypothetical protein J1E83_04260 [Lachnospiraceae bacterium]|nr:hypothetical protein [Lachnospiraceae bacterium]